MVRDDVGASVWLGHISSLKHLRCVVGDPWHANSPPESEEPKKSSSVRLSQWNRRAGGGLRAYSGPKGPAKAPPGGIAIDVNDERLLQPEDVASVLAVSKATVYRLARSGELASVRVRGLFRFPRQAVADFLAAAERPVEPKRRSPLSSRPRKQWVPVDAA